MIRTGQRLENPAAGIAVVFRKTAADTGGAAVVLEVELEPRGNVLATHVHPHQEQRFEVIAGSVAFRNGRTKLVAGPGRRITIPAGVPHAAWNAGSDTATLVCEIRPARQFESLVETLFSLAAAGRSNSRGVPSPLRLAVVAEAHFDTLRLPRIPVAAQWLGLAVSARFGRALGYLPHYSTERTNNAHVLRRAR